MPSNPSSPEPYPGLARHWRARFGQRVQRISLDPGFSCPNRDRDGRGGCIFCDPAAFTPRSLRAVPERSVAEQLADGIVRLRSRGVHRFAAYFQPRSNTFAPLDRLEQAWDAVLPFAEVVALCVGTRPDCVPDPVLDLLASYRERFEIWLELGLQSCHDETLARLGRGHTAEQFRDAAARSRRRGLLVCAHVILGLPGETGAMEARTADLLAQVPVDGVKLHQLAVVRGTELEAWWRRGDVAVLTEAEYVARAVAFLRRLPRSTVIHRLAGDTSADRLLAPRYDKGRVLRRIRAALLG